MPDENAPLLTPVQRRLAGFALGFVALLAIAGGFFLILAGLERFVGRFSNVLWPLATAGILALVLRPVVTLFERRLKLRRPAAVVLLYGVFVLLVAGVIYSLAPVVIGQCLDFFAYLPTLWQSTQDWVGQHFPKWLAAVRQHLDNPIVNGALTSLSQQAKDLAAGVLPSLKEAGAGVFSFFRLVASVAVIPVFLFFFLLSDAEPTRGLEKHLPFLRPEHREDVVFLVREFIGIVVAFFRGQLLIGLIMGLLYGLGFSVAGLKFGLALGLIMGLLNVVPYLGSILGLSVALPLALFQPDGSWLLVGMCAGVFVVVQATESWLLTPRIMGRQTGLHPVAIIVAIFFWGQAIGGVLGLMLAVPLTAFFVTAWRLLRRKYFVHAEN